MQCNCQTPAVVINSHADAILSQENTNTTRHSLQSHSPKVMWVLRGGLTCMEAACMGHVMWQDKAML